MFLHRFHSYDSPFLQILFLVANHRNSAEMKKAKAPNPPAFKPSDSDKSDKYYLQLDEDKDCAKNNSSYCWK